MGLFDKIFSKGAYANEEQICFEKDYEHAMELYKNEGLAACKPLISKLSNEGCIKATLFIRERLLEGIASFASAEEKVHFQNAANNLLRIAADQGDTISQFIVGTMFENGNFFMKDLTTALYYYRLAAEAKHPKAQNNLALCYLEGKGTPVDYAASLYWLKLSAKQNNPRAFLNLGYHYCYGKGVNKDWNRTRRYYKKAINVANKLLVKIKKGNKSPYYEIEELNSIIELSKKYIAEIEKCSVSQT